jgi:hypothetical protein
MPIFFNNLNSILKHIMMKKIIGGVVVVLAIILFAVANPFSLNDAGNRQVIQTLQGDLSVKFDPGLYFSGFFSKVTTYPNNVTIQVGPEEKRSDKADYWEGLHYGTFAGGDQASIGHTTKWDLPNSNDEMIELHTTYNNITNLMTTTLLQYQKETATYSCQRMESEAHYSGGQSQLKEYFQDQLRKGQVLLNTETKMRVQDDGTSEQYIEVNEKTDENGEFLRTISDIQKYNLYASFVSIDHVDYDPRIDKKLQDKIDAAADESTSKQRLITAQQEEQEAIVNGRKLIAETTAREEADEQTAVIQARKAKLVSVENLAKAKNDAAANLATKKAAAEGDRLKVLAGLSPLEKATIEKETAIGVAKAIAGPQGVVFPKIVSGGSGVNGGGSGALQTLELKMLNDLINDLSGSKKK